MNKYLPELRRTLRKIVDTMYQIEKSNTNDFENRRQRSIPRLAEHEYEEKIQRLIDESLRIIESYHQYDRDFFGVLSEINRKVDSISSGNQTQYCRLNDSTMGLSIKNDSTGQTTANNDLKSWLSGASLIRIADPYFFKFNRRSLYRDEADYMRNITDLFPSTLQFLKVYCGHSNEHYSDTLKTEMETYCNGKSIDFAAFETYKIHDRIWIKDDLEGKLVGTSFNTIGKKISFILNLPPQDLKFFLTELSSINSQII